MFRTANGTRLTRLPVQIVVMPRLCTFLVIDRTRSSTGSSQDVLCGRGVVRAPQVLVLAIEIRQDQPGVHLPSAIDVSQDDGEAQR
jgi:hypothetical protein